MVRTATERNYFFMGVMGVSQRQTERFFWKQGAVYGNVAKITARKWNSYKEKFIDNAYDKLDAMQTLNMPETDQINLIASKIRDSSIRAVALTVTNETMARFLDRMRHITENTGETANKSASEGSSKTFNGRMGRR